MTRCNWCRRRVWWWQHRRVITHVVLHRRCERMLAAALVYRAWKGQP